MPNLFGSKKTTEVSNKVLAKDESSKPILNKSLQSDAGAGAGGMLNIL